MVTETFEIFCVFVCDMCVFVCVSVLVSARTIDMGIV